MLLKGLEEAGRAPDPAAAVDMVLIRMAHMASLPAPEELLRRINEGAPASASQDRGTHAPTGAQAPQARNSTAPMLVSRSSAAVAPRPDPEPDPGPRFGSFADLVAYVGTKSDANLLLDLEDKVRLVRFDPPNLQIALTADASPSLAGELAAKLGKWTGIRWFVIISNEPGDLPIGEVRRLHEASEREAALKDPLLQRVLREFPGAEITSVRVPDAAGKDGDTGGGSGALSQK